MSILEILMGRESIHLVYYEISKNVYNNVKACKAQLKVLYSRLEAIEKIEIQNDDLLEEETRIISQLEEIERKIEYDSISSIVFSALTVEAYIYDYGARKLGDSFVKDHLDKLDTISKIVVISQLILCEKFPKDNMIYCRLKDLIKERNSLVHYKSSKKKLVSIRSSLDKRDEEFVNLIKIGINAFETLRDFIKFIFSIDQNEEHQFMFIIDE